MQKFMFLFRGGNDFDSPEAMQQHMQKWFAWMQQLVADGTYIDSDPLENTGKQVNGRSKTVTDGPFTEAKEMVGGYFVINARDMDHAVEISKGCPIFEADGKLEVRPIRSKDM